MFFGARVLSGQLALLSRRNEQRMACGLMVEVGDYVELWRRVAFVGLVFAHPNTNLTESIVSPCYIHESQYLIVNFQLYNVIGQDVRPCSKQHPTWCSCFHDIWRTAPALYVNIDDFNWLKSAATATNQTRQPAVSKAGLRKSSSATRNMNEQLVEDDKRKRLQSIWKQSA